MPETHPKGALSAAQLAEGFRFATDWLDVHREEVNALNVYPVPDGDTGTNMHLTMQSVRRELDTTDATRMPEVARAISSGSLLGARGNSGVILSQLLKGLSERLRSEKSVTGTILTEGLEAAAKSGYAAVMKPVEGTILTVAREAAQGARRALNRDANLTAEAVLAAALEAGRISLAKTPDLLPVLKAANVVDAGGQGYLYVLEGIHARLTGRPLPERVVVESYAAEQVEHEEFGYCTEFLLDGVDIPVEQVRELVKPYGDSLLVVGAEGFVKGHIHTDDPDALLATVGRHGRMVRSKVEDMAEQHTEILAAAGSSTRVDAPPVALVSVVSGYGLVKVFRSLGSRIVSGGQTQNPSVQDIADAARSVEAPEVIVLPNNKNVILAAQQAAGLVTDKKLHVLPTRTLGQGMGAALAFQPGVPAEELLEPMLEAARRVTTLEITRASRDANVDGRAITAGEVIGLRDDELVMNGGTPEDAVVSMLKGAYVNQEIVTVFTGPATEAERADALAARITAELPQLDVEVHAGGPDLYDYLVTLE
ncbi:MAG TPA: DAK2 domain-containing protein [Deinococcales bacterium]|nr:DAK2 domain-containing protein [Deinococcales bacterium]